MHTMKNGSTKPYHGYGSCHFKGAFPAGYLWTGEGLKGPYLTDIYVQKLPKLDELLTVPSGDFQ